MSPLRVSMRKASGRQPHLAQGFLHLALDAPVLDEQAVGQLPVALLRPAQVVLEPPRGQRPAEGNNGSITELTRVWQRTAGSKASCMWLQCTDGLSKSRLIALCIERQAQGRTGAAAKASAAHLKGWNFLPKYCSTTDRNLGTPHSCTRYFIRACTGHGDVLRKTPGNQGQRSE